MKAKKVKISISLKAFHENYQSHELALVLNELVKKLEYTGLNSIEEAIMAGDNQLCENWAGNTIGTFKIEY